MLSLRRQSMKEDVYGYLLSLIIMFTGHYIYGFWVSWHIAANSMEKYWLPVKTTMNSQEQKTVNMADIPQNVVGDHLINSSEIQELLRISLLE